MTTKKSLANTFLLNIFMVILFTILIMGYFLISNRYNKFEEQISHYQDEYINFRKAIIRDEINLVIDNIQFKKEQINKSDNKKAEVVKNELLEWVNKIRLRQNQYIVISKYDGTILAHYKKKNIGKNMWDFTDKNGVKAVQEAIKVSKNIDGGYVSYIGSIRPSTGKPGKKITYAKSIPEWEWSVSTGVYMDDIEASIEKKRMELKKNIKSDLIRISYILILGILVSFIIVKFITNRLKSNFTILSSFFHKAAIQSEKIDKSQIHFSEFQDLITSVNHMTEKRIIINEDLDRHRTHLEELVKQRTKDLEETYQKLNEENKQRKFAEKEKEIKIVQLQEVLMEVKILQGMLPICSRCKKIRDDKGYWNILESYIQEHSEVKFSHGMCPECSDELYGKEDWYIKMKNDENQKK